MATARVPGTHDIDLITRAFGASFLTVFVPVARSVTDDDDDGDGDDRDDPGKVLVAAMREMKRITMAMVMGAP